MKKNILIAVSFMFLMPTALVLAQAKGIQVDIPFEFTARGKALPAGTYEFTLEPNNNSVRVVGINKGPSSIANVITRIGMGIHTTPNDSHIVFDRVGDHYFLSELWIAGMDGFLLHVPKEKHEHKAIDIPK